MRSNIFFVAERVRQEELEGGPVLRKITIQSARHTEGTIRELYTLQRQYDSAKTDPQFGFR